MKRYLGISFATFCSLLLVAGAVLAKPVPQRYIEVDNGPLTVGDVDGTMPAPSKVLADSTWVADWDFETGGSCVTDGWTKVDYRILDDGTNYWSTNTNFAGVGGIANKAAVLGKNDLSWINDGYGSDWDYSIVLKYRGASTLTFDFLSDSEPCCDYVHVETDSAGASEDLVTYIPPNEGQDAKTFRDEVFLTSGLQNATAGPIALSDYAVPGTTHEVLIRFTSDGGWDDADGDYVTFWDAGLIVDDISVDGAPAGAGGYDYGEDFEGVSLNGNVSFENTAPAKPFGTWARVFSHATDNDKCDENVTCQWIWTNPLRPAILPSMAFGPEGGAIVPNWADDIIVSPWVPLTGTLGASGTVLSYRTFYGNVYANSRLRASWSVRTRSKRDDPLVGPGPGDSVLVYGPWVHQAEWYTIAAQAFQWVTLIGDLTPYMTGATELQVRIRYADWQYAVGVPGPPVLNPGPGHYVDRVRIVRQVLSGPVLSPGIDNREQANDAFSTVVGGPTQGEHHIPDAGNIFGTCAWSMGTDIAANGAGPNFVTGDSITIQEVKDVRGAGGITGVRFFGAIVSGPHAGKAPPPYTVGVNGFFEVTPDTARTPGSSAVVPFRWSLELSCSSPTGAGYTCTAVAQDNYFVGGDKILWFWSATDAGGGRGSFPTGIDATNFPPASVAAAEKACNGLLEVSFLPTITWDPAYLAAVAADPNGDVLPTVGQIANSSQKNCILYYNNLNFGRRSTDTQRTAFQYTMDRLGYRGHYDVYDQQGGGNSNNQLGSRADITQAVDYALIVHDANRGLQIPDGSDLDDQKIDMHNWYTSWLDDGANGSGPGIHTLWAIGDDVAFELNNQASPTLLTTYLGLGSGGQIADDQGLSVNPNVDGVASFTFSNGNTATFGADLFALNGGCPTPRNYDGSDVTTGVNAIATHKYVSGATVGKNAMIMNKNTTDDWNTIWQGFSWFDIRQAFNTSPLNNTPDIALARRILNAALPAGCVKAEGPTDVPAETEAVPAVSMLHQNVPNPFNPTTVIKFNLARDGHVRLQIFDVAGHMVKTLVNGNMNRGYNQSVTWNGLDDGGRHVVSGVYFYQLVTDDLTATKKMVMLK
jgi:hypothetical protein